MSIESWVDEFYSIPADSELLQTEVEIIEHSLWKFIGMLPKNLEKHGAVKRGNILTWGEDCFWVNSDSCSLCEYYLLPRPVCKRCPLYKNLGKSCANEGAPYTVWCYTGNPIPMIEALAKTLDTALKKEKES